MYRRDMYLKKKTRRISKFSISRKKTSTVLINDFFRTTNLHWKKRNYYKQGE